MVPDDGGAAHTRRLRQDSAVAGYPRIPLDIEAYVERVRADAQTSTCFICSIADGTRNDHLVVFRDDTCIAFLAKWPTLVGYTLVAPIEHRTDVVASFTADEYVALQRRVHRVGRAVSEAVPTERLYLLSLGSQKGNSHVHWNVAPLPPGVPYAEQQYAALMHEHGYLDIPDADLARVADEIRARLAAEV